MRSTFKNQRGIALLLVIGSIVILTMIGVEFAYNAQIEYSLAVRQKERLQAYYLAYSAYNLVRLELKMGNAVQSQVARFTQQAGLNLQADLSTPLCRQFPMKTALFRLVMAGSGESEEGGAVAEGAGEKEPSPAEQAAGALVGLPLSGLAEFLQFEGDFDAECIDESAKVDLNFFSTQDPSREAADDYKKFIITLLSQPEYQELLKQADVRLSEVVRNIADWIDVNENVNEFGGSEGGSEDSPYSGGPSGQMTTKNGKLSTPEEIYRIAGIEESWWNPLSDLFTIYGSVSPAGKPQINVCRAPSEVVKALVLRYTETRTDLPPLKGEDTEILSELVKTVKGGCAGAIPDKNKIAADLDAKLLELLKARPAAATPATPGGGFGGASSPFADWISTQSRFYRLKLSGQVYDTVVNIAAVIDLGNPPGADTTKWKTVYWKVE